MTLLHVIRPDGFVESRDWTGPLEFEAPPLDQLKQIIGCQQIEHVTVYWHGRRCHMFVDEHGLEKRLKQNDKATRVYYNANLHRHAADGLMYGDFAQPAGVSSDVLREQTREVIELFMNGPPVVGVAALWEGTLV